MELGGQLPQFHMKCSERSAEVTDGFVDERG